MSVIDAIGEGPVEGPVKGLQSILVNKTPLTDTDGNPVIHGVTAVWRAGEQEQTPPEGFESSGSETALGVEVTKAKPVTRTITSANIDRLRVTFGVQSLLETTSKGDRNPSSVRLLIQLQRNGNWVTEKDVTINGKTTSQFLASVILDNLPRPFNIRMVRETADSTTDQLQNAVVVIHRNHRCETVLPEHGHCGAAGGCGAVWRSADDGELPYPRSHHPGAKL